MTWRPGCPSLSWWSMWVSLLGNFRHSPRIPAGLSPPPVHPDQTGQSGISESHPSPHTTLPGRGMASHSTAALPEDDPQVLDPLCFLALDGQDQVPQAAASTVEVEMILKRETGCEQEGRRNLPDMLPPNHLLHQEREAPQQQEREGCY